MNRRPRAFTLVEMVVVVTIVVIIVGLVVPAAATLWAERKNADAFNTLQGLIMTSRASAMKSDGRERGFFSYVDDKGVQQLVTIGQAQPPFAPSLLEQTALRIAYQNVFEITDDRALSMPAPLRAVPRYVVDRPNGNADTPFEFSEEELADNSFIAPGGLVHKAQQHRNFFSMIFSSDGEVVVDRDVLIMDVSEDGDPATFTIGDRTGLQVGAGPPNGADVFRYWTRDAAVETARAIHPNGDAIPFLVVDPQEPSVAMNFRSIDGFLLYDDDAFNQISNIAEKREWLLRTAQPMYISRWTGKVISGPVGEVETQ